MEFVAEGRSVVERVVMQRYAVSCRKSREWQKTKSCIAREMPVLLRREGSERVFRGVTGDERGDGPSK